MDVCGVLPGSGGAVLSLRSLRRLFFFQQTAAWLRAGKGKDGSEPTSSEPDLEAGEGKAPAAGAASQADSAILGGSDGAAPLVARTIPGDSVDSVGSAPSRQLAQVAAPAP